MNRKEPFAYLIRHCSKYLKLGRPHNRLTYDLALSLYTVVLFVEPPETPCTHQILQTVTVFAEPLATPPTVQTPQCVSFSIPRAFSNSAYSPKSSMRYAVRRALSKSRNRYALRDSLSDRRTLHLRLTSFVSYRGWRWRPTCPWCRLRTFCH